MKKKDKFSLDAIFSNHREMMTVAGSVQGGGGEDEGRNKKIN